MDAPKDYPLPKAENVPLAEFWVGFRVGLLTAACLLLVVGIVVTVFWT